MEQSIKTLESQVINNDTVDTHDYLCSLVTQMKIIDSNDKKYILDNIDNIKL